MSKRGDWCRARNHRQQWRKVRNQCDQLGIKVHGDEMKSSEEQIQELEDLIADLRERRKARGIDPADAAKLGNVEANAQRTISIVREQMARAKERAGDEDADPEEVLAAAVSFLEARGYHITKS